MTVSLASTFGSYLHGTPIVPPWEFAVNRQVYYGTLGELSMYSKVHGRNITIPFHLHGFATHVLLQTEIASITSRMGETGTLTVDLGGGDSSTYPYCTFEGMDQEENPWLDASGTNGWQVRGTLKFRQRGQ